MPGKVLTRILQEVRKLSSDALGEEALGVFLQDATILHHHKPCLARATGRLLVPNAFLHPNDLGANSNGFFYDSGDKLRAAKDDNNLHNLRDAVE